MAANSRKAKLILCIVVFNVLFIAAGSLMSRQGSRLVSMPVKTDNTATDTYFSDDEIIQTFFGFLNDIDSIEIYFSDESIGSAAFVSVYNNANGKHYYDNEITITSQTVRISLDSPLDDSYGHEFYLRIIPLHAHKGVSFILADGTYPDNHLLINGTEENYDVAMSQHSSRRGIWIKLAAATVIFDAFIIAAYVTGSRLSSGKAQDYSGQNPMLNLIKLTACTGVLVSHIVSQISYTGPLYGILITGSLFPITFYVVSGYSNMFSYNTKNNVKVYYLKRAFRILPVYYCVIAAVFIYTHLTHYPVPTDEYHLRWIQYVFLLSTTLPNTESFWDNLCATWSIPFFVAFYLLMPLLNKVMNSYRKCLAGTLICAFLTMKCTPLLFPKLELIGIANASALTDIFPLQKLWVFLLGMTAWYAGREQKHFRFIIIMCLMVYCCCVIPHPVINLALLSAVLVICSEKVSPRDTHLNKCINTLAQYSYALYLVHPVVLFVDGSKGLKMLFGTHTGFYILWICSVIIAATYIVHNIVELPAGRLCKDLLSRI